MLAVLSWDPDRVLFTIPYINHPIGWYGLLFASGFLLSYFMLLFLIKNAIKQNPKLAAPKYASLSAEDIAQIVVDRLSWYVVLGTIIGARLGHVLFYDLDYYRAHPMSILYIWEGGLASHGGTLGVLLALFLFYRKLKQVLPGFSFLAFMDTFCIAVPIACFFIRLGNFFNQEILGTPTQLPWAISFGHPMDGQANIPSHPAQLYEAGVYFLVFIALLICWKYIREKIGTGFFVGLLFLTIFGSRFLIEFVKVHQPNIWDSSSLQMGQWLSLPFIIAGVVLFINSIKKTPVRT